MDPVTRVREFLLDNIGHMTHPGQASFDPASQHWFVPVYCRTSHGPVVIGDVEVDQQGHILFAPSREEMLARLSRTPVPTTSQGTTP
jgi:hypothetical protein